MSIVRDKYRVLAPRVSLIRDVVVLAQAWKKAHTYIRRHNWYADTLELDCSAVDLERRLQQWSDELEDGAFRPNSAWLVPAPKNGAWSFGKGTAGGWGAVVGDGGERPVLRPLAHLGIREQTVSTAAMLCLADCIESAQGNTSLPAEDALAAGVFSYGNRLYCRWSNDNRRAQFSWGNATTYSRYFQDYQQFVERPNILARKAESESGDDAAVFIVKLDLSAFYDNVDVGALVAKLRKTYSNYRKRHTDVPAAEPQFWPLLRKVLSFTWRDEDRGLKWLFRDSLLPGGLPQGMLASGFLANAYMLAFDEALGSVAQAGGSVGVHEPVKVHDYCRYVDDLRLVVSVSADWLSPETLIREVIPQWVQEQLDATTGAGRLRINQEKTEVETYHAVGGDAGTAARMKLLQHQLSGPFDVATLQQAEAGLNGLLALAELGAATTSSVSNLGSAPLLASVARPKLEVRDDTLTRFSAFRLMKSLRMRRSMTNLSEELPEGGTAKDALRHDFEVTARRLVAAWALNPSLVQVLRYALDLFPSPDLLQPVISALMSKLKQELVVPEDEARIAYYVLAELFKAGAMETGKRASRDAAFEVGDLGAYRSALVEVATEVLQVEPKVPWYVQQQAALLLASSATPTDSLPATPELGFHRALNDYVKGQSYCRELSAGDELAISMVGFQLDPAEKHYVKWFRTFAKGRPKQDVADAIRLIGHTNHIVLAALLEKGRRLPVPEHVRAYMESRWQPSEQQLEANAWIPFIKVITHPRAIFSEENALLHLARQLTTLPKRALKHPNQLAPTSLRLRCANWDRLKDPREDVLELDWHVASNVDPVYETPVWCGKGQGWMYAFGRLLRAAATGQPDFTARNWLLTDDGEGWYRGIRSTWQSRRTGMLHTSTALVGTTSAITPWFSELLLELLRWPGIANGNGQSLFAQIVSVEGFSRLISARLRAQEEIYGRGSDTPVYRYPVKWPLRDTRRLRVVQVQGLMPAYKDFEDGLEGLDAPEYRERHRNHTAALLYLAYRHIQVRDSVLGLQKKPHVDLVIFPEFAVHVEDQDLMRAFSDATGAMLFYGLVGATAPGVTGPVNAARWLVPQRRAGRRSWEEVDQGKWHLTDGDKSLGISRWRPHQVVIELCNGDERPFRISGAICYDATDLALAADLRNETHMFVVAAMNKDVKTFDSMVSALRYHMYQHVLIANCGEYGGSTAQAPYDLEHKRLISHVHGGNQLAVTIFDVDTDDFGPKLKAGKKSIPVKKVVKERVGKTPPAGLARRK
jgi:hypothetical protein